MTIKAHDVRYRLHGKIEPELLKVLEKLAEDIKSIELYTLEYAKILNGVLDLLQKHDLAARAMAQTAARLEGRRREGIEEVTDKPTT